MTLFRRFSICLSKYEYINDISNSYFCLIDDLAEKNGIHARTQDSFSSTVSRCRSAVQPRRRLWNDDSTNRHATLASVARIGYGSGGNPGPLWSSRPYTFPSPSRSHIDIFLCFFSLQTPSLQQNIDLFLKTISLWWYGGSNFGMKSSFQNIEWEQRKRFQDWSSRARNQPSAHALKSSDWITWIFLAHDLSAFDVRTAQMGERGER